MTRPWTVQHPSALQQVAEGVWCVTDAVPGLPGANRRMSIVRRRDGGLLFYNAIPLPDAQLAEVMALGKPAQLFVPCHLHTMDTRAFAERLGLEIYGPEQGLAAMRQTMPAAKPFSALPPDEDLSVVAVEGFSTGEGLLLVKRGGTSVLLVADVVTNARHGQGFNGLLMRVVGFTGAAPILPLPVRLRVGKNLASVKALLERLALTPGLTCLIPSHGELVEQGAPEALRAIAARL
jgi:hypothetical protein